MLLLHVANGVSLLDSRALFSDARVGFSMRMQLVRVNSEDSPTKWTWKPYRTF